MLRKLCTYLFGTIRGRLIVGVAAVHGVLMALFVTDLTVRQRDLLLDRQAEQATALSQALATSAAGWIAAKDVSGLQELVDAQRRYPELIFAMLADDQGRVLAHSDRSRLGLYLLDLPGGDRQAMLSRTPALVDVATPAVMGGRRTGWARVGIGQKSASEKMAHITATGVMYAVAAIIAGSVIAWLLGRLITARLYVIQSAMDAVRSGSGLARVTISGNDEAAALSQEFNRMLDVMARQDAEVRSSEEMFSKAFLASPNLMAITTIEEGEIMQINDAYCRLLGYERDYLIGRTTSELRIWSDPAQRRSIVRTMAEEGHVHNTEVALRTKSGEPRSVVLSMEPITINGKGVLLSVATDITPRKAAEERLRQEKALLRCIIDSASDLIYIKDCDGRYLGCNRASEEFVGLGESEQVGKTDFDLFSAEMADRIRENDRQVVAEHKTLRTEEWVTYPDGHRVLLDTLKVPFYGADGEVHGLVGISRDITERKQGEEALLKFSKAVEQSPVSIIITDRDGSIEFVNPKFTQVSGYGREEVLGKNPRLFKSGETPAEVYRSLWRTLSKGRVWQGELHNKKKNGALFWEFATIFPIKNNDGTITNYIAIKEDVTERKKLEYQLHQAQKIEAIGVLAGGVAHDFNNILTAIIGFASLLEMKMSRQDPQLHHVTQILAAADRAANLTRSLLAFSRKQQIEAKVLNLNDIVTGLEKMLRRFIREDIELTINPAEGSLAVLVDAGQIEQVLINLVSNARDAMPGGGELGITTAVTRLDEAFRGVHGYGEPGDYALLVVADNGTGMPENVRQRIFDPFFTTKDVGKGTGLGLSVCYGIVKQQGGYITCYSEPGSGTTFRIYLPLVRSAVERDVPVEGALSDGGAETILLAEDDPSVRELTSNLLREFGYTVIEACDGEEAVAKFQADAAGIRLCLFDVIMPKKKGWEAFESIRQIRADAKGLFMSGYQADFDRLNDLTRDGAGFITKPVVPRELLRKVRELLDG